MMTRLRRSSASPPTARLRTQIEGDALRHYPDTTRSRSTSRGSAPSADDGSVTVATARRALANGDGSEVQLLGDARVTRPATGKEEAIEFRSEFLHAFRNVERVRSHLPVVVTQGTSVVQRRRHGLRQPGPGGRPEGPGERDLRARQQPAARNEARRPAGLHHRRLQRHRPGAGAALPPRRLSAGAGRAARRRGRALGRARKASTRRPLRGLRRRRARRRSDRRRRPAPASPRQGVPDVVIANAGISVGMDTAGARRPGGDARAPSRPTTSAWPRPSIRSSRPMLRARLRHAWSASPASPASAACPATAPTAPSKAAVISYCESLRGELRASGVKVVTIAPGYIDTPLTRGNRYAMPFLMSADDFADRAFASDRAPARSYRVIPWQMGDRRAPAAADAERAVRPPARRPAAQAAQPEA